VPRFRVTNVFRCFETFSLLLFFCLAHPAQATEPRDSSSRQAVSHTNTPSLLEQEAFVSSIESGKYARVRMRPEIKVLSQDFFTRYAKDLGLSKDDALKQVLSAPNPLPRTKFGNVVRFQQHYKNLPVIALDYVLQTDATNHVLTASGKIITGLKVDTNPSIPESRALEAAKGAVPAETYCWEKDASQVPKGTLAISFKNFAIHRKNARLVYRFAICSDKPSFSYVVEVDAHTGEILNKINNRIPDVADWNQTIANCQLAG
jgi:Zn-dependent metalloprotease